MGTFHRTNITPEGFIRGAARLVVSPADQAWPSQIDDIIQLGTGATNEVQSITVNGGPTGGSYNLSFRGAVTGAISFDATAGDIQTALRSLSTIGSTGVTVTGTGPFTVTFQGNLAGQSVPNLEVVSNDLTGGTTPSVTITETTVGAGQYDARAGWTELGATKTGIQIVRNNAEETFDVDQIQGDIGSEPTNWEMNVGTALAEVTLERIAFAWETADPTFDITPATGPEKHLGLSNPTSYVQRRLAVLFQRPTDDIRAYVFRKVQRLPQESAFTHAKTGEQASIPVRFRCLPDDTVAKDQQFGEIIDQIPA